MKTKKRIKQLEAEIMEIKSKLGLTKDVLRSITEPKISVEEKPFVLPEKWCVKHSEIALDWIRKNAEINGLNITEDEYYNYPKNEYGNNSSEYRLQGYTEITFEQFLEHVLNASTETRSVSTEPKPVESDTFKNMKLEDVQVNVEGCSDEEIKELSDIFVSNRCEVEKNLNDVGHGVIFF